MVFPALFLRLLPLLALAAPLQSASADEESALWLDFLKTKPSGVAALLPDFSYSGYEHGEQPLPTPAGPAFDVTSYGAVPDDGRSDAEAIQKAVDACQAAGGGVVTFPRGVFILNDDPATRRALIVIREGGVILRGSGSGTDGTILYSPVEIQPEDPAKMWSGRAPIVAGSSPKRLAKPVRIVESAVAGSKEVVVAEGGTFVPGDRVLLSMKCPPENAGKFIAPHAWSKEWTTGVSFRELHEVQAAHGNTLCLAEPLMAQVEIADGWTAEKVGLTKCIGIENIRFRGNWKERFVHHRSWRDDSAWCGLKLQGCEQSWVKNCVFEDMNWPLHVSSSRQITLENITFTGTPGHFGAACDGTYGVLALGVKDEAGHHHGPSVQGGSCSTVYHACTWSASGSFDSHANSPYATLLDRCEGGLTLSGVGGNKVNFPHHLHSFVLWNLNVIGQPGQSPKFWTVGREPYPKTFVQVVIVGLHGQPVTLEQDAGLTVESSGTPVRPESLWLAQLKHRLGEIPPHFQPWDR